MMVLKDLKMVIHKKHTYCADLNSGCGGYCNLFTFRITQATRSIAVGSRVVRSHDYLSVMLIIDVYYIGDRLPVLQAVRSFIHKYQNCNSQKDWTWSNYKDFSNGTREIRAYLYDTNVEHIRNMFSMFIQKKLKLKDFFVNDVR